MDHPAGKKVFTFWDIASQTPHFLKGLPKRVRALRMVSKQRLDTPGSLGICLEECADRHPDGIALVFEGERWTYSELNHWVNRLAYGLKDAGIQRGAVVAVFLENRPELLVTIAALSKMGCVAALVNTSQRGKVLQHSLDLVGATYLVVGEELYSAIDDIEFPMERLSRAPVFVHDPWRSRAPSTSNQSSDDSSPPKGWISFASLCRESFPSHNPAETTLATASEPFCYFYTSGTTGLPKAAVLSNGRFIKAYAGVGLGSLQFGVEDRVLVSLPFYHGTALVVGWGSVLAGSAGLVMVRQFSASNFWPQVRQEGVTAFCYVGELCRYLLAPPPDVSDRDHSLKVMFGNGLRPAVWKEFKERFGIERVAEFYGSSEGNVGFLNVLNLDYTVGLTTVPYAIVEYDLERDMPVRTENGFMRKVNRGEAGLLLGEITDDSPYDGYTDADKTEKTILRNVFRQGDAWFNTGDLMRDQGYRHAQFVDRLGDTYRWKGENVSTAEVENAFAGMTGILDAVVFGVEVPHTNGRAGMACLRLQAGFDFEPELIFSQLQALLPKYAVPLFIRVTQELSKTGTHKYQKTALKKEGYDIKATQDPLWCLLPGERAYTRLDESCYRSILDGNHAF